MTAAIDDVTRAIIARHLAHEGAALPILHALQAEFGYLPEETLPMVADALNVSRAEIYGVATFYHDFHLEPRGKHTLTLCRAEACQSMGGVALAERAKARLGVDFGETTADGQVTLEQTFCLGLCACAPSATVDGKLIGRLTPQKLDAIIAETAR
ncbi:MAG: formate dehydrogenase subunit gamma [Rhodomicrobium sp.]